MARRESAFLGPLLIVVGVLLLLAQAGFPAFSVLWPLFPFAVGVAFMMRYWRSREDPSQVLAGVLLLLIAGLFQLRLWTGLRFSDHWPFFPLAVGLAFLARYGVDRDDRESLLPGVLATAAGVFFYFFSSDVFGWMLRGFLRLVAVVLKVGIPLALIGWGAWILLRRNSELRRSSTTMPEKIEPPRQVEASGEEEPSSPGD
ncbi:MAG TPA: hypothetical protein VGB13_02485 [Candidatus Krumholzibacteria bacterium]|jgi:hypothetical protein